VEVTNRCRHCDKVSERTEDVATGCSSLHESANFWRRNKVANTIHQQIVKKYNLLNRNTVPDCSYKPEPVMESSTMILCRDKSVITDRTIN
jgi:hypothetical protein